MCGADVRLLHRNVSPAHPNPGPCPFHWVLLTCAARELRLKQHVVPQHVDTYAELPSQSRVWGMGHLSWQQHGISDIVLHGAAWRQSAAAVQWRTSWLVAAATT